MNGQRTMWQNWNGMDKSQCWQCRLLQSTFFVSGLMNWPCPTWGASAKTMGLLVGDSSNPVLRCWNCIDVGCDVLEVYLASLNLACNRSRLVTSCHISTSASRNQFDCSEGKWRSVARRFSLSVFWKLFVLAFYRISLQSEGKRCQLKSRSKSQW